MSKEAGRPFPKVSDDDVVDFVVTEAVALKVAEMQKEEHEKEERRQWRKKHRELAKKGSALG